MKLLTKAIKERMLKNWNLTKEAQALGVDEPNHEPVVKLFNPCGAATWLLTELDPENNDTAFGLCDLGFGTPELGYVSLSELSSIKLPFGLGIERDLYFEAKFSLLHYTREAGEKGRIIA